MYILSFFLLSIITTVFASSEASEVFARQSNSTGEEAYLQEVCFPNTTSPIPPCQEIINIQSACEPNGTSSLYLLAHAECMCRGSFFSDWIGCLDCDYVHGARSEQEVNNFNSIITSASHELCTGTPTASFAAIFNSLTNNGAQGTGATGMTDLYPSQTAVSLYFTPSGPQGAGAITGSETAATATPSMMSVTATTTTGSSSAGAATGGSSSGSGSAMTTMKSSGAAVPTGVYMGVLGLAAGGAAIVAL